MSPKTVLAGMLILAAGFSTTPAAASSTSGAHVAVVAPNIDGSLVVYLDAAGSGRPACATQDRWALNVSTLVGQSIAASIYMAMASNMKIDIVGTGACDVLSGSESISYVVVHR